MNVEQHRTAQRINATARARLIADGVLTEGNDMNDIVEAATAPNAMPLALALYFDERMFAAAERTAVKLSKAQGFVPRHLLGNTEACFAVVTRSFAWRMDPFEVARKTYQTPGGGIGFEGKLVQAVIENSGRLQPGGVTFEHYGDWSKVQGRFAMREGKREDEHGNKVKYAAPAWTDEDAKAGGCGVIVRATLRGEGECEVAPVDLVDAALNQALGNKPVHETAGAVAGFADQQPTQGIQGERAVVAQDAQNLGLGRRDSQRA